MGLHCNPASMPLVLLLHPVGTDASSPFDWGAEGWRRMTWHKVLALDRVAVWGFNVVVSDMDVAWLRDPLPLFGQHPHAGAGVCCVALCYGGQGVLCDYALAATV